MGFDMLLQVLRTFEGFAAEVAFVRLERDVNADMRGDMIALHGGSGAITPTTRETQIVGALATDMSFTDVFLSRLEVSCRRCLAGPRYEILT